MSEHIALKIMANPADEELSWRERALCAQTDPESFFPEKGGSTREAKRVCISCEVKDDCLEYALDNDERFGIWGGLSERERRRLKRLGSVPSAAKQIAQARTVASIVEDDDADEVPDDDNADVEPVLTAEPIPRRAASAFPIQRQRPPVDLVAAVLIAAASQSDGTLRFDTQDGLACTLSVPGGRSWQQGEMSRALIWLDEQKLVRRLGTGKSPKTVVILDAGMRYLEEHDTQHKLSA